MAGGVIVLLLVVICLYVLIKRQRRKNRKTKKQESDNDSTTSSREQNNYEDSTSQKSWEPDPDYLETLPDYADDTDPRLEEEEEASVDVTNVTLHRQGSSYYNTNIVGNDELEDPMRRTWEYEPNDEALAFDLKQVKFDRTSDKLPRLSFEVDPRQSTTSFT